MRVGFKGMSGAGLLVVATLCLALLLCVLTACIYTVLHPDQDLPGELSKLLAGLVPAVGTLLAKTYADGRQEDEAVPVEVVSSPADPVVTTDVASPELDEDPPLEGPVRRRR